MKKIAFITTGIVAALALAVSATLLVKEDRHAQDNRNSVVMVVGDPVGIGIAPAAGTDSERTVEEEVSEKADFVYRTHVVSLADLVPEEETAEDIRTAEELASYVLDHGLDGSEREEYLGDRYDEVQEWIDSNYSAPTYVADDITYVYPEGDTLNPYDGINYHNGVLETYYDLPMEGLVDMVHALGIEGTYWVREDGVKMWDDYVIVAADFDYEPRGTITETSLGTGIVLDTGEGGWGWHDIAVEGW